MRYFIFKVSIIIMLYIVAKRGEWKLVRLLTIYIIGTIAARESTSADANMYHFYTDTEQHPFLQHKVP